MYIDYFLKFASEADSIPLLFDTQQGTDEEGNAMNVLVPKYAAVDVVGVIYKPTGKVIATDEDDVPEMAPLEGWHVNVRTKDEAPDLEAYRVHPTSPVRVWF